MIYIIYIYIYTLYVYVYIINKNILKIYINNIYIVYKHII